MLKAVVRRELLQKRLQYSPEQVDVRSQEICRQFFSHFSITAQSVIHIFLPIRQKNEVNTWYIIQKLQHDYPEVKIVVPVTNMSDISLSHFLFSPATTLTTNKWGIPEPENAEEILVSEIDLVLVPLLAFDLKGHRVGYGKGFYDRFLTLCRPDILKIGLSLEDPIPAILDAHDGDSSLTHAITPNKIYRF